ncbi:MAG: 16S rRNA processing protein RimM [Deltaproteobacteria bacterium]|jgi:16S rRNA processing protein RimM|nr:16S rRNA processing protein RimM [Deltaproteobacteria bacterium]
MPPINRPTRDPAPGPLANANPSEPSPDLVRIGRIAGIHGLRGALKCRPDNPESESFATLKTITIQTGGQSREYQLLTAAPAGRGMLKIELAGIADANAAEALKGGIVMVARASLPPTQPHEFYYFQAIGCEVFLTDQTRLGTIAEVFSNGAHDVMVVRGERREILIPVIEDIVKSLDLDSRRVVIESVPGLIEG